MKCLTNPIGHATSSSAGFLAVSQVYGYMCWNSLPLAILMTTTGFVFLRREDGGVLYMSRMYGSHRSLQPFQYVMPHSMAPNSDFTISHLLYWFTALTEQAQPILESSLQQAIRVLNAQRYGPTYSNNLQIGVPTSPDYIIPQQDTSILLPNVPYGLQSIENMFLEFRPWLRQNHRGGRAWSGVLLPERLPVIIKCWDSNKHTADRQKTEVDNYLKLQGIWGSCVPRFIGFGRVGFCHALILEYVEVMPQY